MWLSEALAQVLHERNERRASDRHKLVKYSLLVLWRRS